jgi:hypothetical protein
MGMTEVHVGLADVQAVGDVLDWLCEQSDGMGIEAAVEMAAALDVLAKKVAMAKSLCETQAKKLLDGQPARIGDKIIVEKATGKWRPNQSRVKGAVLARACYDENGELEEYPDNAAERAIDMMFALYVSPSQMPKAGGLKELRLKNEDVADWERTGSELKVIDG